MASIFPISKTAKSVYFIYFLYSTVASLTLTCLGKDNQNKIYKRRIDLNFKDKCKHIFLHLEPSEKNSFVVISECTISRSLDTQNLNF